LVQIYYVSAAVREAFFKVISVDLAVALISYFFVAEHFEEAFAEKL
jgi:hypothetical protein